MGAVFVAALPVMRGLYHAISFLLALALAAMLAYFAVLLVRLLRQPQVQFRNFQLKVLGRLTHAGWSFAVLTTLLGLLVLHSSFIRYHTFAGEQVFAQAQRLGNPGSHPSEVEAGPKAQADHASATTSGAMAQARKSALTHLQQAYRWGLYRPAELRRQLAMLYQQSGLASQARIQLYALLAQNPEDLDSQLHLGRLWLQEGRLNLAKQQFQQLLASADGLPEQAYRTLSDRTILGAAHFHLGDLEAKQGNTTSAMRQFEMAVHDNPQDAAAHLALGAMRATAGQLQKAEASFKTSAGLQPDSAAVYNNLGAILMRLHRQEEALEHYRRSLALMPENPLAYYHVGLLLAKMGQLDQAEENFQQALTLQPNYAAAHAGLALIWQQRGQPEQADWHRQRAAQLRQ